MTFRITDRERQPIGKVKPSTLYDEAEQAEHDRLVWARIAMKRGIPRPTYDSRVLAGVPPPEAAEPGPRPRPGRPPSTAAEPRKPKDKARKRSPQGGVERQACIEAGLSPQAAWQFRRRHPELAHWTTEQVINQILENYDQRNVAKRQGSAAGNKRGKFGRLRYDD